MADSILYLDVETTGKAKAYDQVVQVAYASEVDGELVDERCVLVRPSIPISPEAIEVHGITDEMVSGAPTFADAAGDLVERIEQADIIATYNGNRFDIPILDAEFKRAGIDVELSGKLPLDSMRLLQEMRPRRLTDVHERYVGSQIENAHDALADVRATQALYRAMKAEFGLEESSERELSIRLKGSNITVDGNFKWQGTTIIIDFGKYWGRPIEWVVNNDPGYLRWILGADRQRYDFITMELLEICRRALDNARNCADFYQWVEDTYGGPPEEGEEPDSTAGGPPDDINASGHETHRTPEDEGAQRQYIEEQQIAQDEAQRQYIEEQQIAEDEARRQYAEQIAYVPTQPSPGDEHSELLVDNEGRSINCQLCGGPLYAYSRLNKSGVWSTPTVSCGDCGHDPLEPGPDFEGVQ